MQRYCTPNVYSVLLLTSSCAFFSPAAANSRIPIEQSGRCRCSNDSVIFQTQHSYPFDSNNNSNNTFDGGRRVSWLHRRRAVSHSVLGRNVPILSARKCELGERYGSRTSISLGKDGFCLWWKPKRFSRARQSSNAIPSGYDEFHQRSSSFQ